MPNPTQPNKGRPDDPNQQNRPGQPGSQGQNTGAGGMSNPGSVTGQKNKPGVGQPGRGGDDLSGQGQRRSDSRQAEDQSDDDADQNRDKDKNNIPGRTSQQQQQRPGASNIDQGSSDINARPPRSGDDFDESGY